MSTSTFQNVEGLRRALRGMPKHVQAELRDASGAIATTVGGVQKARAAGIGRGWQLLAPTIRASRGREPAIRVGGARRIPGRRGSRQAIGDLLFGTEFGGRRRRTTQQFLPLRGVTGYVLFEVIRAEHDYIDRAYAAALGKALEQTR